MTHEREEPSDPEPEESLADTEPQLTDIQESPSEEVPLSDTDPEATYEERGRD